jgi:hypothetical protein
VKKNKPKKLVRSVAINFEEEGLEIINEVKKKINDEI